MSYGRYYPDDRKYGQSSSGFVPTARLPSFQPSTVFASTQGKPAFHHETGNETLKNMAKHDPFCRACKEFHDWVNKQQNSQTQKLNPKGMAERHGGCPLDREELGRTSWSLLHSVAGYYPDTPTANQQQEMAQFVSLFGKYFPCRHCSEHFMKHIHKYPPDTSSRQKFSRWMCDAHNKVNAFLGKPIFDCSVVDQRWRDGFPDGSCD